MPPAADIGSRVLLRRLRQVMAQPGDPQARLDRIVSVIATNMVAEVCSIYLRRDEAMLELCATEGLRAEAVHRTRFRYGQGLVGRIAQRAEPLTTTDAPRAPGFEYRPETGEEIYSSFCGVPIQRLGKVIGVLVVQNAAAREYTEDEIDALEVIAMVIAEMADAGQLTGEGFDLARSAPKTYQGVAASDGAAIGPVHLHEPKLAISNPFTDDVEGERARLDASMVDLRHEVDALVAADLAGAPAEYREVLEAYRMFAHDKGWLRRLHEAVASGVVAEVAVERVQSAARSRMERAANPYLRDRLHDLDDLANRLLRRLNGGVGGETPQGAILVCRTIGPGELLDHGGRIAAVVMEEGAVGSHAAIVARALAIPMVVGIERIVAEAENGDAMIVDGDRGEAFLRPPDNLADAYREKIASAKEAEARYREIRGQPAETRDGAHVALHINAGLLSDMPNLHDVGAAGVGLYRTELQFLTRPTLPRRADQAALYGRVLDAARGAPVVFRTLDIGSDKVLPYMRRPLEENPALGWRAIRVGLDKPFALKMQAQALLRGAGARPLRVMFPFIAAESEFYAARDIVTETHARLQKLGYTVTDDLKVGAMLETPSLAYASDSFFSDVDFLSVGGNDLLQFFFAADRGNERVRRRYDTLSASYLGFLRAIIARADAAGTPISFCGEAAGRAEEAVALAAIGFRALSMRPASIGRVKFALRAVELQAARSIVDEAIAGGAAARPAIRAMLARAGAL
ncbi:phosphoenolpyruvate--protein phosphotransferase [Pikeienuella piscinae]|uniref:phosphoenolpyruvate--protein phosphotransferase n=1 Tax=Pikeienuella piscinae TaxID=2748098 RepID=A0A7L5BWK1_9RHOB|nr:phosphoenolpyruvate--protein phosphotransferase [Pikeienuella piscinae]QIE53969.1 phosphoenolpyruvate--protein phosphotransferase [Pikeienuella piscinae]